LAYRHAHGVNPLVLGKVAMDQLFHLCKVGVLDQPMVREHVLWPHRERRLEDAEAVGVEAELARVCYVADLGSRDIVDVVGLLDAAARLKVCRVRLLLLVQRLPRQVGNLGSKVHVHVCQDSCAS
jgi:hypothetical protein